MTVFIIVLFLLMKDTSNPSSAQVICCVYDLFGKDRMEMVVYLKRIIAQTFGNEVNKDSVKLTV